MKKWKKVLMVIGTLLLILVLLLAGVFIYYRQVVKKENNLVAFKTGESQELYILGTLHNNHFGAGYKYSLADIQAVIDNLQPDLVLLEYRQEVYDSFGVIDGPVEMLFAAAYSEENGYPVQGVDAWRVEEGARSNATNDARDDEIYANILREAEGYERVLVLVGFSHRMEQAKRLKADGFERVTVYVDDLFRHGDGFSYPESLTKVMEDKIEYLETSFVVMIDATLEVGGEDHAYWRQNAASVADALRLVLERYVEPGVLH